MENVNEQGSSLFDLSIDSSSQQSLEQTSKWARFLAIVVTCFGAIFTVGLIVGGDAISKLLANNPLFATFSSAIILVAVLVLAVLSVFVLLLFRFSSFTIKGIRETNQEDLEKGIGSLKTYFMLIGIFGILGLLFSIISLAA